METRVYQKSTITFAIFFGFLLVLGMWSLPVINERSILVSGMLKSDKIDTFMSAFAQDQYSEGVNKTKLVYHLSSDEPWRATIAILDSQTMLRMGYNVTLMLSIEGVQLGVKNPHHYLGLGPLTSNVTDFIQKGGTVIICEVCLKIAGYNNKDILDGSIIGTPSIMAKLLNQTTVVDY